jgi:tRNA U55 pseudouridine synthase TruB
LLPLDRPLQHLPEVLLAKEQASKFCSGTALAEIPLGVQEYYRVYDEEKDFLGIGRNIETILKPEVVVALPVILNNG